MGGYKYEIQEWKVAYNENDKTKAQFPHGYELILKLVGGDVNPEELGKVSKYSNNNRHNPKILQKDCK